MKVIKPMSDRPLEPKDFSESLVASFNLMRALFYQKIMEPEDAKFLVQSAGDLMDLCAYHGEELLKLEALVWEMINGGGFFGLIHKSMTPEEQADLFRQIKVLPDVCSRRSTIKGLLEFADVACLRYVGWKPFTAWYDSNDAIDSACRDFFFFMNDGTVEADAIMSRFFFSQKEAEGDGLVGRTASCAMPEGPSRERDDI